MIDFKCGQCKKTLNINELGDTTICKKKRRFLCKSCSSIINRFLTLDGNTTYLDNESRIRVEIYSKKVLGGKT
jgi:DNA-directed RNA polymerase subunit RPC12/RpoP